MRHSSPDNLRSLLMPAVCLAFSIGGFILNLVHVAILKSNDLTELYIVQIIGNLYALSAFAVIIVDISVWKGSLTKWGFVFGKGFTISLGLVILATLLIAYQTTFLTTVNFALFVQIILRRASEELIFRALMITEIRRLFHSIVWNRHLAVIASSLLFTVTHIPTKSAVELISVFTTSLLLGYIYLLTGSILFPIYAHCMADTAQRFGWLIGVLVIVIYILITLVSKLFNKFRSDQLS